MNMEEYLDLDGLSLYDQKMDERFLKTASKVELDLDNDYIMTVVLKNSKGEEISSQKIDFPLESVVINATYSDKKLSLSLQNGSTVDIDVSDLISGLVSDNQVATIEDLGLGRIATVEDIKRENLDESEARFINSHALVKWIEYWWNNISVDTLSYVGDTGNYILENTQISASTQNLSKKIPFNEDITFKLTNKSTTNENNYVNYVVLDKNNLILQDSFLVSGTTPLQTEVTINKSDYPDGDFMCIHANNQYNMFSFDVAYYEPEISLINIGVDRIIERLTNLESTRIANKLEYSHPEYKYESINSTYYKYPYTSINKGQIAFDGDLTIEYVSSRYTGSSFSCNYLVLAEDGSIIKNVTLWNWADMSAGNTELAFVKKSDYPTGHSVAIVVDHQYSTAIVNVYRSKFNELLSVNDTIDRIIDLENNKVDKDDIANLEKSFYTNEEIDEKINNSITNISTIPNTDIDTLF